MKIQFAPHFSITRKIRQDLRYFEEVRRKMLGLSLSPKQLRTIARLARKEVIFYVSQMEDMSPDKHELKNYLAAYDFVLEECPITEKLIKHLHAKIIGKRICPYRRGQNAVLDSERKEILYLPPKADDVPILMHGLIDWIDTSKLAAPLVAGVAHFAINSIHPYYDGNGRLARLLTKLILRRSGYDIHGLLCLEDFYFKNYNAYYDALTLDNSKDYYSGPAKLPITRWLEYFCKGMRYSTRQALYRGINAKMVGSLKA